MTSQPDAPPPATSADILWFLPTHGDGRFLGATEGARHVTLDYLSQVARAADACGYYGVLLPTGKSCEDSWVIASAMVPLTRRLRFLVAVRPGLQEPAVAARMAATLDRISDGRLLINVVTGGDPGELRGDGVFLDHSERYAVTDEFLTIWRELMRGETVSYKGRHLSIEGGKLLYPPVQQPYPPLYFGGSSEAGLDVAGRHVDYYLTWGEPPEAVAEKFTAARAAAEAHGRTLRFGLRIHLIVRETEAEAWDAADRLISKVTDEAIEAARERRERLSQSEGQRRMTALHGFRRDALEIAPNLWAGVGLIREGAGTALVGDPETVAARLRAYQAIGVDTIIASGYPHLEEAYTVAELLLPALGIERDRPETRIVGRDFAASRLVRAS
jgi:alkanesulfonate monooxygenase